MSTAGYVAACANVGLCGWHATRADEQEEQDRPLDQGMIEYGFLVNHEPKVRKIIEITNS